jgi:DNA-directed RNA polymerase subunit RPC12/RpoP
VLGVGAVLWFWGRRPKGEKVCEPTVASYRCGGCKLNWPNVRKKYGGNCPACGLSTRISPDAPSDNHDLFEAWYAGVVHRREEAAKELEAIPVPGEWDVPDPRGEGAGG